VGMGEGSRESKGEGSGEAWRTMGASVAGASSSRPEMSRGARGRRVDDCAVVELVRELMVEQPCGPLPTQSVLPLDLYRRAGARCGDKLGLWSSLVSEYGLLSAGRNGHLRLSADHRIFKRFRLLRIDCLE
jgi:hypothetical protein